MKPTGLFEIISVFTGACIAGVFAYFAIQPADTPQSPEGWVEMAREAELTPCFYNIVMARLYWQQHADLHELSLDEKVERFGVDRVIDSGSHKDVVVPEECFAVATGLYGFNITFWQRPRTGTEYDMSIPYWTPAPDQRTADAT
jgi:hypothetical protein